MKKKNSSKPNTSKGLKRVSDPWKANLLKLRERLFRPVDALPLAAFRILFGLLMAVEFFVISRQTFPADYISPPFHFTYPLFDFLGLRPLSASYLWIIFRVLQVSTVGIMLGLCTRLSLIVFTSTFGYFFLMESAVYSNHYYLIFLLSFLMCLGNSGSLLSLDNVISKRTRREQVDFWEILLLRFQISVVFFFGALAKMNADWLVYGAPLYLNFIRHFSFMDYPLQEKWMAVVLSWAGMLSDLALGLLLLVNRWHCLTFIWLCLFNGLNVVFFGLGIKTFPYLMIFSYVLFISPGVVRRSLAGLPRRKRFGFEDSK